MSKNPTGHSPVLATALALFSLLLPACNQHADDQRVDEHDEKPHEIIVTNPELKPVEITQDFVCQIHSRRHIQVRALERGYLQAVTIKEGQRVKAGEVMFKVIPVLYQTKADAVKADADYAQLEYNYTKKLTEDNVVSSKELLLRKAELSEAQAKAQLAAAELNFSIIKAPFDGIIDRLHEQQGSLAQKGDVLTTLSDNRVMWVYFNVPEKIYLDNMADADQRKDLEVHLRLADGSMFKHAGKISTVEADFDNKSGNILFRADFPNPESLLRNGQTGTVIISHVLKDALVIPQRATFEFYDKRYVYVVDKDHVAQRREVVVEDELEDVFVIKSGLAVDDRIILEGTRQVRNGDKVDYVYRPAKQVDEHLKYHAE